MSLSTGLAFDGVLFGLYISACELLADRGRLSCIVGGGDGSGVLGGETVCRVGNVGGWGFVFGGDGISELESCVSSGRGCCRSTAGVAFGRPAGDRESLMATASQDGSAALADITQLRHLWVFFETRHETYE